MDNLVLVYGSLRKGGALQSNMDGADFVGTARVPGRMVRATSFYPAVVLDHSRDVLVEVYRVNDQHLHHLDMVEGHPTFYQRHEVETEYGVGWMYFWTPEMAEGYETVESGDWIAEWKEAG